MKSHIILPYLCVLRSLPTRERGLKYRILTSASLYLFVAPHAGARIEIDLSDADLSSAESLPTRERGLKFTYT